MPTAPQHVRVRKGDTAEVRLNGRTYTVKVCLGYDGRYDVVITERGKHRNARPPDPITLNELVRRYGRTNA